MPATLPKAQDADGEPGRTSRTTINSEDLKVGTKTMKRKSIIRDQSGFTLIEIIAVLIILGISRAQLGIGGQVDIAWHRHRRQDA